MPRSLLLDGTLDDATEFSDVERLTLRVAVERLKGASSLWEPYFDMLPSPAELHTALYVRVVCQRIGTPLDEHSVRCCTGTSASRILLSCVVHLRKRSSATSCRRLRSWKLGFRCHPCTPT